MNHHSSRSLTGYFVLAGAILGIMLGWLLPRASPSSTAQPVEATPTAVPDDSPALVWAVPTQTSKEPEIVEIKVLKVGSIAPDFMLKDRSGKPVQLSDFKGSPVVINFWASWCPPCKEEMPDLQWIADRYSQAGFVVLGVNTTYIDERQAALAFVDELGLTFPILFDESGEVGSDLFSLIGLPTSFWIDRQGVIRQVKVGAMSREDMIEMAELLLLP